MIEDLIIELLLESERTVDNVSYTIAPRTKCWEVDPRRARNKDGYPVARIGRKVDTIYRHSFRHNKGLIPEDQVVRHTCDNRNCINPDHLILGSRKDNVDDMHTRNRAAIGEHHGRSVLKTEMVKEIRKLLKKGEKITTIATGHGVDRKTVRNIRDGVTWKK